MAAISKEILDKVNLEQTELQVLKNDAKQALREAEEAYAEICAAKEPERKIQQLPDGFFGLVVVAAPLKTSKEIHSMLQHCVEQFEAAAEKFKKYIKKTKTELELAFSYVKLGNIYRQLAIIDRELGVTYNGGIYARVKYATEFLDMAKKIVDELSLQTYNSEKSIWSSLMLELNKEYLELQDEDISSKGYYSYQRACATSVSALLSKFAKSIEDTVNTKTNKEISDSTANIASMTPAYSASLSFDPIQACGSTQLSQLNDIQLQVYRFNP